MGTLHIFLAHASPSLWVTYAGLSPISVTAAGDTLRELVEARSTLVTLLPCDSRLAPALPTVPVTLRDGHLNGSLPGAVADFTASHRVEVEGIQLTDLTMRLDCVGWAETLACHLFTKASATITRLAVWESIVACRTAGALSPDDIGPARALPSLRTTAVAGSPSGVALTGYGTIMVKGYQGPCRILTESRGCLGINIKTVSSTTADELGGPVHGGFVKYLVVIILCRYH